MLVFIFVISILTIFILISSIRIKIEDFNISNYEKIEKGIKIFFQIILFKEVLLFSKQINLNSIEKIYLKQQLNIEKLRNIYKLIKENREYIKIKNLILNIKIGTGDVILTAYIISIISTIISSVLPRYIDGEVYKNYFKLAPIYDDEIKYKVSLDCIIPIKTVHIIHIIYLILKKRRDEKYGRTSNRKSYENSYE